MARSLVELAVRGTPRDKRYHGWPEAIISHQWLKGNKRQRGHSHLPLGWVRRRHDTSARRERESTRKDPSHEERERQREKSGTLTRKGLVSGIFPRFLFVKIRFRVTVLEETTTEVINNE